MLWELCGSDQNGSRKTLHIEAETLESAIRRGRRAGLVVETYCRVIDEEPAEDFVIDDSPVEGAEPEPDWQAEADPQVEVEPAEEERTPVDLASFEMLVRHEKLLGMISKTQLDSDAKLADIARSARAIRNMISLVIVIFVALFVLNILASLAGRR